MRSPAHRKPGVVEEDGEYRNFPNGRREPGERRSADAVFLDEILQMSIRRAAAAVPA